MDVFAISEINLNDKYGQNKLEQLLKQENISKDANLDYTVGIFDENYNLIATGSCYANTLRCLAVDSAYQGKGLLNSIVSHLVEYQMNRGNSHLFVYTKCDTAEFFASLGFYEIARVNNKVVFMENRNNGFKSFLESLAKERKDKSSAAIVANCNPFTLGHRFLIERAAAGNDGVHLFVVSEDASLIPFTHRYEMVQSGCRHLNNVILHKTRSYMISNSVFPSYFLKEEDDVINAHATLDIALFAEIAKVLGIKKRYVGEEPFSKVTNIYNSLLEENLPQHGVSLVVIPRSEFGGKAISASYVRQLLCDDKLNEIKNLVPESTFDFFNTEAGLSVVKKIKESDSVIHY